MRGHFVAHHKFNLLMLLVLETSPSVGAVIKAEEQVEREEGEAAFEGGAAL